jgi:hypothetical protein
MLSWSTIELGLQRLTDLARANGRVWEEFERSRGEFFADPGAARAPLAQLRHLEWFLLERPSSTLGATPALSWLADLGASGAFPAADVSTCFRGSIPGAFEVTSLVPAEGLRVRDLFTQNEHPVAEARAMTGLDVGDLLVGRLFPAGGGAFLLSPSVSVFRSPALLAAVRRDLEGMRAVRRGVLRVQQIELEHLFHGQGSLPLLSRENDGVRARAREGLLKQGLEPDVVENLLDRVRSGARSSRGQVVTDMLNGLAFETWVDLAAVRLILVDLWESERRSLANGHGVPSQRDSAFSASRARAALEAFDRGRAEGKDLELLFRELERDLGVEGGDGEEHAGEGFQGTSDFPGVIEAIVEEFLWEVGREEGAEQAGRLGILRSLGEYARDISVFEELGPERLLDFSARWMLDEGRLAGPAQSGALMDALAAYCKWCEERHDVPLWSQFGKTLDSLRDSLPRHALLRQDNTAGEGGGAFRVVRIWDGTALARDAAGRERSIDLTARQEEHLRPGDIVRLAAEGGSTVLGATYPGEVGASFFRAG